LIEAREWLVTGRVQGVGFRRFVVLQAEAIGVTGWVRNERDGSVMAYAVGTAAQLDELAGHLHLGPRFSTVRGVEQRVAGVQQLSSFRME
jgi:acylphosphatase